jgi:DNA-binding transcriptional MocR family regulator
MDPRSHAWEWSLLDELLAGDARRRQQSRLRKILATRCQSLETVLRAHVVTASHKDVNWRSVDGGLYLWLEGLDAATRHDHAPCRGMVRGPAFGGVPELQRCVRINLAQMGDAQLVAQALLAAPTTKPTSRGG